MNSGTEQQAEPVQEWFVLVDPTWTSTDHEEAPPRTAMVGGWPLDEDGNPGPFLPSPEFVPSGPEVPTDPTDAVLRLLTSGEDVADQIVPTLLDAIVEIAVDEDGRPLVGTDPAGVACVAVATAPAHKRAVGDVQWQQIAGADLVHVLPVDTDVMVNPAGPSPLRLYAAALSAER